MTENSHPASVDFIMFTGIVEGVGSVLQVENRKKARRLWIKAPFSLAREKCGDSVAVEGVCLTIVQKEKGAFAADVSPETLKRSTLGRIEKGMHVNLERPLTFQSRLGGHIVQGHVDGMGVLISKKKIRTRHEEYFLLDIQAPRTLRRYLVEKGSVTVDGISLTVNQVASKSFTVCVIPHTQKRTTLTDKKAGDRVNLEVDILAKYLEKLIKR